MSSPILDSKSKQRVLLAFIKQPSRYFSAIELSRRTKIGPSRLKGILSLFLKNQILQVAEKKKVRFYQIDRHSAIYGELSKIFGVKEKKRGKDIIEKVISRMKQIKYAVLTGIMVGLPRSQVDLLLVGRVKAKHLDKIIKTLEKIVGCELNYSLMSEEEYLNRLYSFDWFVKEINEKDPVVIIDKLAKSRKKMRTGGHLVALTSGKKT